MDATHVGKTQVDVGDVVVLDELENLGDGGHGYLVGEWVRKNIATAMPSTSAP